MNRPKYEGLFCSAPWEYTVIQEKGDVHLCSCSAWVPSPVGNLEHQAWDEVWNGTLAQAVRASILDGSFKYCDDSVCPYLNGARGRVQRIDGVSDPEHKRIIDNQLTHAEGGPKYAQICHDPTCNLTCPSCRCDRIVAKGDDLATIQRIQAKVEAYILPKLRRLDMSGQGEVFASRVYLPLLRNFSREKYPHLKIWLTTNGVLLNERMWDSIRNSHEAIHAIHVSVNAATKETYLQNQEGGHWEQFLSNMDFVGGLRRAGIIQEFTLGYYVQVNNYRELPQIVKLVDRFHVDKVYCANMTNWGTYSDAAFRERAVHLPDHPEHEAFKASLLDPALQDARILLGNLMRFLPDDADNPAGLTEKLPVHSVLELCRALSLDRHMTAAVCDLVNTTKQLFVDLIGCPPQNADVSPLAFLAQVDVLNGADHTTADGAHHANQFSDRLQATHPIDKHKSYAELAGELSFKCQLWFEAMLPDAARAKLRHAGTIDWIGIESTKNPLGDTVAHMQWHQARNNHGAKASRVSVPQPIRQIQQAWKISDATAQFLAHVVNELKKKMAEWCATPSDGDGRAPIDILAKGLSESQPNTQQEFQLFFRHAKPEGADECYAMILHHLELEAKSTLRDTVPKDQWHRLNECLPRSLFQLATDFDPVGDLLAKKLKQMKGADVPTRQSGA